MSETSKFTVNKDSSTFKELEKQKFFALSTKERQKIYDRQIKKISLESFQKQVPVHCLKVAIRWGVLFGVFFMIYMILLGLNHFASPYSWLDPFYVGGIVASYFFAGLFFIAASTRLDGPRMINQAIIIYCGVILFHFGGAIGCFARIITGHDDLLLCAALNIAMNLTAVLLYIFVIVVNEKQLFSYAYNKLANFFSYPCNQFYLED